MAELEVVGFNSPTALEAPQGADTYVAKKAIRFEQAITADQPINGRRVDIDGTKLDLITVTTATDLDEIRDTLAAAGIPVVFSGFWNPILIPGYFPVSTKAGESWIVTNSATVDGVDFTVNDRIMAINDNASAVSYIGEWLKLDYNNLVTSVAGRTGDILLTAADIDGLENYLSAADIATLAQLNALVGDATLVDINDMATAAQGALASTALQAASVDSLTKLNSLVLDATLDDISAPRDPTPHIHDSSDIANLPTVKSYSFTSRDIDAGINYFGGFYDFSSTAVTLTDVSTTVTFGDANRALGAHAFIVVDNAITNGSELTITVTGTSYTDNGIRTINDTEILVQSGGGAIPVNSYFETTKKWLGTITFALTSNGTAFSIAMNYGVANYETALRGYTLFETDFVGFCNRDDLGFNLEVLFHSSVGWTYAATGFVAGSLPIATLAGDYGTESALLDNQPFAWRRNNLTQVVATLTEGVIIRITTTDRSVSYMSAHLKARIT